MDYINLTNVNYINVYTDLILNGRTINKREITETKQRKKREKYWKKTI